MYLALGHADIDAYLTPEEQRILRILAGKVVDGRRQNEEVPSNPEIEAIIMANTPKGE
jgi:hypothetical protein